MVAAHGVVAVLDAAGDHLHTWPTANFPAEIARAYALVPVSSADDMPVWWTTLTGQTLVLASLEEIAARFPRVAHTHEATGTSSLLSVPVRAGGRAIGALAFGFGYEGTPGEGAIQVAETALSGAGPASVLDALDQACPDLTGTDLATVAYAEYEPAGPDGPTLTYACAGHPPPLLADGGTVRFLDGGRSRALAFRGPRTQARITVPLPSRLVLYTDGLIERRTQALDTGFEQLARAVGELPAGDPRASCARLLSVMTGGEALADDVAVACIDLTGPGEGS